MTTRINFIGSLAQEPHRCALTVFVAADLSIKLVLLQFTRCTTRVELCLAVHSALCAFSCLLFSHGSTWQHVVDQYRSMKEEKDGKDLIHCFLVFTEITDHSYRLRCDILLIKISFVATFFP